MSDFYTKCFVGFKKMRKTLFFIMMTVSAPIYAESIDCQVLKKRIVNELKHIETLRAADENKNESNAENSQVRNTPFSDAYAPLNKQQQKLNSEVHITHLTKEYKQKCE